MTQNLSDKSCVPCRGGIPPLTMTEAQKLLPQASSWTIADDASQIERGFRFKNFKEAMVFVNKVGELAEKEGHHPDIKFGWGYANIVMKTHKIKGLHENDFIMATKINSLSQQ